MGADVLLTDRVASSGYGIEPTEKFDLRGRYFSVRFLRKALAGSWMSTLLSPSMWQRGRAKSR